MTEGKCPPHCWDIDYKNVGVCRDCDEERDFGEMLERRGVFVAAGRRGAKASKGVDRRPYRSRRGRVKKEVLL